MHHARPQPRRLLHLLLVRWPGVDVAPAVVYAPGTTSADQACDRVLSFAGPDGAWLRGCVKGAVGCGGAVARACSSRPPSSATASARGASSGRTGEKHSDVETGDGDVTDCCVLPVRSRRFARSEAADSMQGAPHRGGARDEAETQASLKGTKRAHARPVPTCRDAVVVLPWSSLVVDHSPAPEQRSNFIAQALVQAGASCWQQVAPGDGARTCVAVQPGAGAACLQLKAGLIGQAPVLFGVLACWRACVRPVSCFSCAPPALVRHPGRCGAPELRASATTHTQRRAHTHAQA